MTSQVKINLCIALSIYTHLLFIILYFYIIIIHITVYLNTVYTFSSNFTYNFKKLGMWGSC